MIPVAVGKIDAITQAIRDGDRERAFTLLEEECKRLHAKRIAISREVLNADQDYQSVLAFACLMTYPEKWNLARKECGWSGEDG